MQHKLAVISMIIIFTISISQKKSFAPIIPSGNTSDYVSTNAVQQYNSIVLQNNFWYIMIIVGMIIGVILIYFTMVHNQNSRTR